VRERPPQVDFGPVEARRASAVFYRDFSPFPGSPAIAKAIRFSDRATKQLY
jgi:hypothetical protein